MQVAPGIPDDLAGAVFRVGRAYGMTADRSDPGLMPGEVAVYQAVADREASTRFVRY